MYDPDNHFTADDRRTVEEERYERLYRYDAEDGEYECEAEEATVLERQERMAAEALAAAEEAADLWCPLFSVEWRAA